MKRRTIDTSREIRLWLAIGVGALAAFPEARQAVIKKAKQIKDAHYPTKIKDKIIEATSRKRDEDK